MTGEHAEDRRVFRLTGNDRVTFLQGLVSNDVQGIEGNAIYAALLNAQGKYLADFFLIPAEGEILLDVKDTLADGLIRRLSMYRLRADVRIEATDLNVTRGLDAAPPGAVADPRHHALGWRLYGETRGAAPTIDWDAIRVAHLIPETGIELVPEDSYILECGFERLHGVNFRKGCYVGQEVTARMKHKTKLRKGLALVAVEGEAATGTPIMTGEKEAGRLLTRAGDRAIAYLRFDRAEGEMVAGAARVTRLPDPE